MRHHDHDHPELETDTAQRVRTEDLDPTVGAAAAARRPDVLGASGMLGIQRTAGNAAAGSVVEESSPVHEVVSGGGAPLSDDVRTDMETRMGQDFGDVRVHTGDAADASARSVSAHAYTVGSNVVFQRGAYDPDSSQGRTLLAHELTHVVQQRSGPVDGTPTAGGVSVSDPSDRFEVEAARNAEQVMSQPVAPNGSVQAAHDASLPAVQREAAEEEEEPMQAAHDQSLGPVQREAAEEEEEMPS